MLRIALIGLVVALAFGFTDGGTAARAAGKEADARIELTIKDRVLVGSKVVRVTQGQTVDLRWTTDELVELHLHGYDIEVKVKPDGPASMKFKAHATGRYPVTAHRFGDIHSHGGGHSEQTLLYLEVHPD